MYKHERVQAVRRMRGKMWSPGRPSTARREDRVRFWEAIARGVSTEDAAALAGVSSAVGTRWYRDAGGMPSLTLAPVSGRYLSFAERKEIAILHAQKFGVRKIAGRVGRSPSTISRELRRNASTRSNELTYRATTAQWHAERRASRPKVSKLAANEWLRAYVRIVSPARSLGPTACACRARMRRSSAAGTGLARIGGGQGVESRADLQPPAGRFPR